MACRLRVVSALGLLTALSAFNVCAQSPTWTPDYNHTALHQAAKYCAPLTLREALEAIPAAERGVEIDRRDQEGYTPLMCAAESGCFETVRFLVEAGADVSVPGRDGRTPLMAAVIREDWEVARFLVRNGADPTIQGADGKSVLDYAKEKGVTL